MKKGEELRKKYNARTEASFKELSKYSACVDGTVNNPRKVDELLGKSHLLYKASGLIVNIISKDSSSIERL